MFIGTILWVVLAQSTATTAAARESNCAQALAGALADSAAGEICAGEAAMRLANAAPKDSQERVRQLRLAAADFQKAATAASKLDIKVLALNSLADVYDAKSLNDPKEQE